MSDKLEPWQIEAINYIEHHHSVTGVVPTDDAIIEHTKSSTSRLAELKSNELFKASMDSRGIVMEPGPGLTQRQMAAASSMMNLTDRRSDEKKLRDLGISTEEYTNWMQDVKFADYMRERAELMVTHSVHEAHMGMMRGVRQGNTASIKLYYELTGRYNPNEESNVNVRMVIGRVLEAVQKHVREPTVLNALAVELSQIAIESGSPVAKSSSVPGMSTSIKGELYG